jgi:pyrimidine deaminase RibD-like protein
MPHTDDLDFMRHAIDRAKQSKPEDARAHPLVGAVVVLNGRELGAAFRSETAPGDHAEEGLLEKKLCEEAVVGSTVYTTLEPCTRRGPGRTPCAKLLVERKVSRVVIGMLDPDQTITGKGILLLRQHGIAVDLFPPTLMAELEELNRKFIREKQKEFSQALSSRVTLYQAREELYAEVIDTIARVSERQKGHKAIFLTGLHGESGARRPELLHENPVLHRFDEEMLRCAQSSGANMWYVRELYNIASEDRLDMILKRIRKAENAEGYEVRAFCSRDAIPQFKSLAIGNEDLFLGLDDPTYYRVRSGVHIHGEGFTELAKEHFDQLWSDGRLFWLRTALGEDTKEIQRLSAGITRIKRGSPIPSSPPPTQPSS